MNGLRSESLNFPILFGSSWQRAQVLGMFLVLTGESGSRELSRLWLWPWQSLQAAASGMPRATALPWSEAR